MSYEEAKARSDAFVEERREMMPELQQAITDSVIPDLLGADPAKRTAVLQRMMDPVLIAESVRNLTY
jgi:hypothetical protein